MTEYSNDGRTIRHKRNSEIEADKVTVQFGPQVIKDLARLENVVSGKQNYDNDALALLRRLSSAQPLPIENAIRSLLLVTQETAEYAERTDDPEMSIALCNVIAQILEPNSIAMALRPKSKVR